jgi:hypothetical protein
LDGAVGWLSERSRNGGVDEVPLPDGLGRLWLAGKHFVGPDAEGALERTGAQTIVCLNERHEFDDRYPDHLRWLLANRPDRAVWWPIPDLHAPPLDEIRPLLDDLLARLRRGDGLLVHCGAGVGRAGTVAAALLVRSGVEVADALEVVAAHRPMAGPESEAQRELVRAAAT